MRSVVAFYLCLLALSLACVVCVSVWNNHWRGGFKWDGSSLQFNWHPVLMVTGMVVLYGNGAVAYRAPLALGQEKMPWKLLHAALMLLALVVGIVGLCAVFDFHNANKIANLYSLHSWIGIAAAVLFGFQWAAGLTVFLLPCASVSFRKLLKPLHMWLGGSIIILTVAACISGINEKLFFSLQGTESYSTLPPEAVFANVLGVLIVAFALVVFKFLSTVEWQRPDESREATYTPLLREQK